MMLSRTRKRQVKAYCGGVLGCQAAKYSGVVVEWKKVTDIDIDIWESGLLAW